VYHPQALPDFQGQFLRTHSRDLNWLSGLCYCYRFETFLVIYFCPDVEIFEGVELPAVRFATVHIKSARNSERLDERVLAV